MFNLEFKDANVGLLVIVAALIVVAIVGTNPLAPTTTLGALARVGLGALGIVFFALILILPRLQAKPESSVQPHPEYTERFEAAQSHILEITPEDKILSEGTINGIKIDVVNGNILDAKTEIIVSSDDNHFSARGGVARAILDKAGPAVKAELSRYRTRKYRQGQIAITAGGEWKNLAIIHPAVIDLDENRYPDKEVIRLIVRRCLSCTIAFGAESLAFPVLGGGTASKTLKPTDSANAIVETIAGYLRGPLEAYISLRHVVLYIYDKSDAAGLPANLDDLLKA